MTGREMPTGAAAAAVPEVPLSISEAARGMRSGELGAVELTEAVLRRADALDPVLGSILNRDAEAALRSAREADADLARGLDRGPLQGVPLGIKDVIAVAGLPTTAQSPAMTSGFHGGEDARVVARLRAAGAIIVGTTTTMEFAIGFPDPAHPLPAPRNPYDLSRWAGGSSSGSASGIAVGFFLGALGTDTGGSIRIPSSFCGTTGLKPTFGLVPKSGVVPVGYTHDVVGPMGRSALDCAYLLQAMADRERPEACYVHGTADVFSPLRESVRPMRIGVPEGVLEASGSTPAMLGMFDAALKVFWELGHEVVPVELPHFTEMQIANDVSRSVEAWSFHRENLCGRWSDYGVAGRGMIVRGALTSAGDYVQAQRVRRAVCRRLAGLFADVDVVATPVHPDTAPRVFEPEFSSFVGMVMTSYWNAAGYPALALPMGTTAAGLPAGLQIAAAPRADLRLLALGHAFQQVTPHHLRRPDLTSRGTHGDR